MNEQTSNSQNEPENEDIEDGEAMLHSIKTELWLLLFPKLGLKLPTDEELEQQYSFDPRDPLDDGSSWN